MASIVSSLYELCICSISELLLKIQNKIPVTPVDNPFSAFHPDILHDLIVSTGKKAKEDDECFKSSYVYPLITTGRVTSLDLTVAYIVKHDAEAIFNYLQPYSEKLKSLKLSYKDLDDCLFANSLWMSSNLGTLLRSAKNLICLKTSIRFDLSELSLCENLEKLTLNFVIDDDNFSFLRVDGKIRYNHSLKMLRILNISENDGLEVAIAEILQYCVEIIEIDYDVSQSLVYLHKNQKATKYKLQKTSLGNIKLPFTVSEEMIEIASLYCRDLRTVDASPTDFPAFRALSNFRNITNLTLHDPNHPLDFNQAIRPLLEGSHFSPNLKTLVLRYFTNLDVSCIGACCPRLEEFTVEYISENNQCEFTTYSFKNLKSLFFKNEMRKPCREDSIIALLSESEKLEFLTINDASKLKNTVLDIILLNTSVFSKMKSLTLVNCGLTEPGLEKLARSLISAERVSYSTNLMSLEDIETIFRRYRSNVTRLDFAEDDE